MRASKKSDLKQALREQAKRKVGPNVFNPGTNQPFRDGVEAGRRELQRHAMEGGDPIAKRVKGELTYLLNNYLPSYDMRIEQLIDAWRRSGDPSYDPGIRLRFRQARKDYMDKGTPV